MRGVRGESGDDSADNGVTMPMLPLAVAAAVAAAAAATVLLLPGKLLVLLTSALLLLLRPVLIAPEADNNTPSLGVTAAAIPTKEEVDDSTPPIPSRRAPRFPAPPAPGAE